MAPTVYDFRKPEEPSPAEPEGCVLTCPVFLVGFMGAGKTTVSRKLARLTGAASIDMDRFIERRCDKAIKDLFAEIGEEGFRAIESDVLRELAEGEPRFVSCGGGVVLKEENREILKGAGCVVYLKVTAEEAASRISDVSTRPLFGNLEQAQRVIDGRLAFYEEVADLQIETAGRGSGSIAHEIAGMLKEMGVVRLDAGEAPAPAASTE